MFKEFSQAIRAYGEALQLSGKLRLWGYFLIPSLISILLGVGIGWGALALSDNIGGWITGWYPWEWGSGVVQRIGEVLGGLLVASLGLILYKNLVIMLAGPFMSPLSEKVEAHLSGHSSPGGFRIQEFISDFVRGVQIGLRNILRELVFTMLLLLLGLIAVFSPVAAIGIFLVQSFYAGFGNMDYTLERHYRVKGSVSFVKRHSGLALGNGVVFMGLLLTGIGFLIAPPLAAVAATLETVRAMEREDNPV